MGNKKHVKLYNRVWEALHAEVGALIADVLQEMIEGAPQLANGTRVIAYTDLAEAVLFALDLAA